mgnify:CR=1 FL=1
MGLNPNGIQVLNHDLCNPQVDLAACATVLGETRISMGLPSGISR